MPSLKQSLHRFRFRNTAGTPGGSSKGNRAEVYVDVEIIFDHVLRDIRRAQRYVWLETYIFEKDEVGKQFMDALTEAARRGCDVRLLIDRFGSPDIGTAQTKALEEAGGTVAVYNPLIRNRSEEHTSELQSRGHLVCRLLLEKKTRRLMSGDRIVGISKKTRLQIMSEKEDQTK